MRKSEQTAVRLTDRLVKGVEIRAKDYILWDSVRKGMGLRVFKSGRKSFIFGYRSKGQRRFKRIAFADASKVDLSAARETARDYESDVTKGLDPAAQRTRVRTAPTVANLWERFLTDVEARAKGTTIKEWKRLWKAELSREFGARKVADVAIADVARFHRRLKDRPYVANRSVQLLRALFNFAITEDERPIGTNPAQRKRRSGPGKGIVWYPEHGREKFLNAAEFRKLGAALTKAEREGIRPAPNKRRKPKKEDGTTLKHRTKKWGAVFPANPAAVACLRLLTLTGLRKNEALTLEWSSVDMERGFIRLPESKTGKSIRPLGAGARELLASLPEGEGRVFTAPDGKPLKTLSRIWAAVIHEAKLPGLRIHDLRHSLASQSAQGGDSLLIIRGLLGHTSTKMSERYSHLSPDPIRAAADRVSLDIAAYLSGSETEAEEMPAANNK